MKRMTLKNTVELYKPYNGETPITEAGLNGLGFRRMENGRYELAGQNNVYICYFRDENTVSLKRIRKDIQMYSQFGYQHLYNFGYQNLPPYKRSTDRVTTLEQLKELISNN